MKPKLTITIAVVAALLCAGCKSDPPADPPVMLNLTNAGIGRAEIVFGDNTTNEVYELTLRPGETVTLSNMTWYPSAPSEDELERFGFRKAKETPAEKNESLAVIIERLIRRFEDQIEYSREFNQRVLAGSFITNQFGDVEYGTNCYRWEWVTVNDPAVDTFTMREPRLVKCEP